MLNPEILVLHATVHHHRRKDLFLHGEWSSTMGQDVSE
jgi:hypothetical protein